jgi:hypothetical protein
MMNGIQPAQTNSLSYTKTRKTAMNAEKFRQIALSLAGAIEGAHMGHPDFRANGKIFAALYPDGEHGMVKLTPDQQQEFLVGDPAAFTPASGAWGRQGCTTVLLALVNEDQLGEAMTLAWKNTVKADAQPKKKRAVKATKQSRRG